MVFIFFIFLLIFLNLIFSFKFYCFSKFRNFECGFESLNKISNSFRINFFFILLIFIIFDLEILILIGFLIRDYYSIFSFLVVILFVIFGLYLEWVFGKLV